MINEDQVLFVYFKENIKFLKKFILACVNRLNVNIPSVISSLCLTGSEIAGEQL